MLTFRRALLVAAVLLTFLLLLRNTHTTPPDAPSTVPNSPRPTGSYSDNKLIQNTPPMPHSRAAEQPQAHPSSTWNGDNGGRVSYKRPRPQIPIDALKQQPIRKQLEYAFPYDPEGKFPAYIWQTWKHTPASGQFAEGFRAMEASWTELHPSFVHEVITDSVAEHLVRHFYATIPEVYQAYQALPEPVLKADFFRYLILLARGGIYSDIDTTALKSAVEWVPQEVPRSTYGLVVAIEADAVREDWQRWYSRRVQFCQWTIQSKPGHPVLRDIVASITQETLNRRASGELDKAHMKSVMEFTGPALWTDVLFKFFNDPDYFDMSTSKGNITWRQFTNISQAKKVGDVVILPITSFSPGIGHMNAGEDDDPMAFVKHHSEGTWKPEWERHIGDWKAHDTAHLLPPNT